VKLARKNKAPVAIIGKVGGEKLVINRLVNIPLSILLKSWGRAIEKQL
jgi:hypothetical protein